MIPQDSTDKWPAPAPWSNKSQVKQDLVLGRALIEVLSGSIHFGLFGVFAHVRFALQEAFELLKHLGDPIGARFAELGWNEKGSPLQVRNESIAGHGFAPVLEKTTNEFLEGVLFFVADYSYGEILRFSKLVPYGKSDS